MESLPCQGCRGLCCGPVPISEHELKRIKKKVKSMPPKLRSSLQNQNRYEGTCIFYDLEHDRCGIHSARPDICRAFGYHKNLTCFRKPGLTSLPNYYAEVRHIGVLSIDFTWKSFS